MRLLANYRKATSGPHGEEILQTPARPYEAEPGARLSKYAVALERPYALKGAQKVRAIPRRDHSGDHHFLLSHH